MIRAECEDEGGSVKHVFTGTIDEYSAWRTVHSDHGHLVQTFRDADDGPSVRYWCQCGQTFFSKAAAALASFFNWCKRHRKHGIRGDVS